MKKHVIAFVLGVAAWAAPLIAQTLPLPLPPAVEKELAARASNVTEVTLGKNMLGFAAKFMNGKDKASLRWTHRFSFLIRPDLPEAGFWTISGIQTRRFGCAQGYLCNGRFIAKDYLWRRLIGADFGTDTSLDGARKLSYYVPSTTVVDKCATLNRLCGVILRHE